MMLHGGGGGGGGGEGVTGGGGAAAADTAQARDNEMSGGGGGGGDDGERFYASGGNRWPRQETLALLKIRSEMDAAFRDSSVKGPLWDEVSRKLSDLGFHRSAKKCKEKFENVYKYHKRTKEGRTSKQDGKMYPFFEQLEALEAQTQPQQLQLPPPPPPQPLNQLVKPPEAPAISTAMQPNSAIPVTTSQFTVPSINPLISTVTQNPTNVPVPPQHPPPVSRAAPPVQQPQQEVPIHFSHPNMSSMSFSTSSYTSSDEGSPDNKRKRKRKRNWKEFFGRLMKEVIDKQEEMQTKFLETLEKRDKDRMMREEAWRVQEMTKVNREHELLAKERSLAAAKDAAVLSFLQKITEQQNGQNVDPHIVNSQVQVKENVMPRATSQQREQPPPPQPTPQPTSQQLPALPPIPQPRPFQAPVVSTSMDVVKLDNGGIGGARDSLLLPSPSRWPKAEIEALIRLRTTLDMKYQENGPKGPLWEEISTAMKNLGYNRNAKRCKEKWENINKYYKKVKESSKRRPEDSKTCPYFHQLDAVYREKAKTEGSTSYNHMAPIMAQPEQQWPTPQVLQHHLQQQQAQSAMQDHERANTDENHVEEEEEDDNDEDFEEDGDYQMVTNKSTS